MVFECVCVLCVMIFVCCGDVFGIVFFVVVMIVDVFGM